MRIAIVGGGPSGLLLAYLTKRAFPGWSLRVWEQNPPDATFGFGIVLAAGLLRNIQRVAPELHAALAERAEFLTHQTIEHRGERVIIDRTQLGGDIARLKLLEILQGFCRGVGVELQFGARLASPAEWDDADLIVGADGVNSAVRAASAEAFGTRTRLLNNRFAWYGTTKAFDGSALVFKSEGDGVFIAHYYRYSPGMSTFVAECDAQTWDQGFSRLTDAERKTEIERLFAADLEGHPLIENNSIWRQFPVVDNQRWSVGNTVLIGDALRSVHFSIGSGTRVAMEDAICLFETLSRHNDNVPAALADFEAERRPSAEKLTAAAERSYEWYERVREAMARAEPYEFIHGFMVRTGRMTDARLRTEHPGFMAAYDAWVASA